MNDNQQFRAVLWDIDGTLLLERVHALPRLAPRGRDGG